MPLHYLMSVCFCLPILFIPVSSFLPILSISSHHLFVSILFFTFPLVLIFISILYFSFRQTLAFLSIPIFLYLPRVVFVLLKFIILDLSITFIIFPVNSIMAKVLINLTNFLLIVLISHQAPSQNYLH